jgi:hypothetical protein
VRDTKLLQGRKIFSRFECAQAVTVCPYIIVRLDTRYSVEKRRKKGENESKEVESLG